MEGYEDEYDDYVYDDDVGEEEERGMHGDTLHTLHEEEESEASNSELLGAMDSEVMSLRKAGQLEEALELMEKSLVIRIHDYGPGSNAVVEACEGLTTGYNTLAMRLVEAESYDTAYELLKKAEVLTDATGSLASVPDKRLKLAAITMNNLGCFYKRRNKLHAALHYLERALEIEERTAAAENPAGTHLNICATLSELGRHQQALGYAKRAIEMMRGREEGGTAEGSGAGGTSGGILAIAYHNLAVEQDFLGMADEALEAYVAACETAAACWGEGSSMHAAMVSSLGDFRKKMARAERRRGSAGGGQQLRRQSSAVASVGGGGGGGGGGGARPRPQSARVAPAGRGPTAVPPRPRPVSARPAARPQSARKPTAEWDASPGAAPRPRPISAREASRPPLPSPEKSAGEEVRKPQPHGRRPRPTSAVVNGRSANLPRGGGGGGAGAAGAEGAEGDAAAEREREKLEKLSPYLQPVNAAGARRRGGARPTSARRAGEGEDKVVRTRVVQTKHGPLEYLM